MSVHGENMKPSAERKHVAPKRRWLWFPTGTLAVLMLYFCGAVAARVMYERGVLGHGSPTFQALDWFFTPLKAVARHSPVFREVFDWCVVVCLPETDDD